MLNGWLAGVHNPLDDQTRQIAENITVLIVDDHEVVGHSSASLLYMCYGFPSVVAVTDPLEAIEMALNEKPQIIIMDLAFPKSHINGVHAILKILAEWPDARILAMSGLDHPLWKALALEAGAVGWIAKVCRIPLVAEAIIAAHLRYQFQVEDKVLVLPEGKEPQLSQRERQVLELLVVSGLTPLEIGEILQISPSAVKTYRGRLVKKLDS